jgi:hypothetical protein
MNTLQNSPASEQTFKQFLFHNKRNKTILYLAATAIVIQFAIFKYLYPFANYIHGDSFAYLDAADKNLTINTYLVGYSKFLRLVSIFAKPDIVLVSLQYLMIQCSTLILLFTIFYFYRAGRVIQIVLLFFMVFNPLFLHLGNMISSDGFFLSLSMAWFTVLLWIMHRPSTRILIWHAVILFIAFTVRYNAMIYPIIAGFAFGLSKLPLRKKIWGLGLCIMLPGWFMAFTMYQYKKLTGYSQFSPFSGWQFANNAMYAYRYVNKADHKPVPEKYQALDNMIRNFYEKTNNGSLYPSEKALASTFYMWSKGMPLMNYRDSLFKAKDSTASELKKWASMGPLYKSYGLYIIRKYPLHFATWFLWPNAKKYYAPPVEFLEIYNTGKSDVTQQTKLWFGYKNRQIKIRMEDPKIWVLDFFPILSGVINVLMLFGMLYFLLLKGWQYNQAFNKPVILGCVVWLLNALFTIFASSAALRFQSFPILLTTIFAVLLIDWMVQLINKMKIDQNKQSEINLSGFTMETNIS